MNKIINVELMRHPANWIVLTLMFIMASFMLRFVMSAANIAGPSTAAG